MRRILLIILVFSGIFSAYAYDAKIDGIYYNFDISTNTAEVTNRGFTSDDLYSGDITIPETISYSGRTFTVTSIGYEAFAAYYLPPEYISIKSISLPKTIKRIKNKAFEGCDKLTSFTVPASVEDIAINAFDGCTKLEKFVVNIENHFYSEIDGMLCSKDQSKLIICPAAKSLKSFTMPSTITTIGESCFKGGKDFIYLELPKSVTTIEYFAFNGCKELTTLKILCPSIRIAAWSLSESIKSLSLYSETPPEIITNIPYLIMHGDATLNLNKIECEVYVPSQSIDNYRTASVWKDIWNYLPLSESTSIEKPVADQNELYYDLNGNCLSKTYNNIIIKKIGDKCIKTIIR